MPDEIKDLKILNFCDQSGKVFKNFLQVKHQKNDANHYSSLVCNRKESFSSDCAKLR